MKKNTIIILLAGTLMLLTACGSIPNRTGSSDVQSTDPVSAAASGTEPVKPAEQNETSEAEPVAEPGRQDGERFETVIILEGMEETVRCEHLRNDRIGIEMDYDYESFVRHSEAERESFVSVWDDPDHPENYLEVSFSAEDAETVAAAVREELSQEYDLLESSRELEKSGSCIRIEASELKGTGRMADQLQVMYIIPASDGCRVAAAHYASEAAEGFGRRFSYLLNTLAVIDRNGEGTLSDEQALSAIRNYCHAVNPELESIEKEGEYPVSWTIVSGEGQQIAVLFRSYTGAEIRYYIDRTSGDVYVTEFVPGITSGEERTDENFNVRDYF